MEKESTVAEFKKYKDMVDGIDHVVLWSAEPNNLNLSFISKNAPKVSGYDVSEWMTEGFLLNHVPPEDQHIVLQLVADAKNGKDRGIEHRFIHKDGHIIWLHTGLRRAKLDTADSWEFRGISADVTRIMEAEDGAKKSEGKFLSLSESVPNIVFMTDPKGNLLYLNGRWFEYTGIMPDDFSSKNWLGAIHPDDLQSVLDTWEQSAKNQSPWMFEYRLKRRDGIFRWHMGASTPEFSKSGEIIRWVGTVTDIEELKRTERDLRQKTEALENSLNGFDIVNAEGKITYANKTYLKMWGYQNQSEVLGQSPAEHCADPNTPAVIIGELKAKGECNIEFKAKRKDGSLFDVVMWARLAYDSEGNEIYPTTSIDITKRNQAEEALKYQSYLTETITSNAASSLFMQDRAGLPTFMNPAAEKLTGYKLNEIRNVPLSKTLRTHKLNGAEMPNQVQNAEDLYQDKAGRLFPVSYSLSLLKNKDHVIGSVLEFRDISLQKETEKQLTAAKEESEKAHSLKSAFLANMSHEIRTPLGAMIGFADLLRDPLLSENERTNYLSILARNGQQLSFIINDILDLSKVEAGHLTLEFLPLKPAQIIMEVVSLLRINAQEKNIQLQYINCENADEVVVSDPVRVRQVIMNLVSNAIKFTAHGSVTVTCRSHLDINGKKVITFDVQDTGIGIPKGQENNIFEMFVQADGSMTRRFGGTGLGLALSRKLALALGGTVQLMKSKVSEGSLFCFTFLDQPEKQESKSIYSEKIEYPARAIGEKPLKNKNVLIVDDSSDNRNLICHYLNRAGATTTTAENGFEGKQKALDGHFDLILMDIQMPVMDGFTATQSLRELGYVKPIIALTAHAMSEVRRKALHFGCTDHLTKPINPIELIESIVKYTN